MGYPKQRGEFLVYGAAHSVHPVTGLMVSVSIVDIPKKLQVSGLARHRLQMVQHLSPSRNQMHVHIYICYTCVYHLQAEGLCS